MWPSGFFPGLLGLSWAPLEAFPGSWASTEASWALLWALGPLLGSPGLSPRLLALRSLLGPPGVFPKFLGISWALLGSFPGACPSPGASWTLFRALGPLLGPPRRSPGSWASPYTSWAHPWAPGPLLVPPALFPELLGLSWGLLALSQAPGPLLRPLGALSWASGPLLGSSPGSWAYPEASWGISRAPRPLLTPSGLFPKLLGLTWGVLGSFQLGLSWDLMGAFTGSWASPKASCALARAPGALLAPPGLFPGLLDSVLGRLDLGR